MLCTAQGLLRQAVLQSGCGLEVKPGNGAHAVTNVLHLSVINLSKYVRFCKEGLDHREGLDLQLVTCPLG